MGALFIIGSAFARIELDVLHRVFVGAFGLAMVLTAVLAKDKTLERWFGGL